MAQVIHIRRQPNGWDKFGQGIESAVDKYTQGSLAMAKDQNVITQQMLQHALGERRLADANARDDRRWTEQSAMQERRFAQEDKHRAEQMALQREQLSRSYAAMSKPQYDSSRGGFVRPDGTFQPLQMPEGYTPPTPTPQPTYKDAALADAARASLVPEDQRTDAHRQAIALGTAYGYKPQGSGELEVLPMDTAARKEAFELRNQWDEAERVQRQLETFEKSGGQGGTGLLLGMLPSTIANRVDPGGTDLRSAISQMSSVIMNALSGAAVSEQERKRLEGFLPTAKDDLPTVQRKLGGYRDYISTKTHSWRGMYGGVKPLEGIQKTNTAQVGGGNAPALPPGFKVVQ